MVSLEFYLGHPVPQYRCVGEPEFGKAFDTGRQRILLAREEEIEKLLEDNGALYLVSDEPNRRMLGQVFHRPLEWLAGNAENQLFRVRTPERSLPLK